MLRSVLCWEHLHSKIFFQIVITLILTRKSEMLRWRKHKRTSGVILVVALRIEGLRLPKFRRGNFCVFCFSFQALAFSCPPCFCLATQCNLYFLLSLTTPETVSCLFLICQAGIFRSVRLFKIHRVSSKQVRKTSSRPKIIVYIGTKMPEKLADQKL